MNKSLIKLKPYFKDYVWGGYKLKEYGKESSKIIAESWELSTHSDGLSFIYNQQFNEVTLKDYIKNNYDVVNGTSIPLLIKLIDANQDLSIQVHPNDEYSLKHENQLGKTEMWYVIECDEGSYIYYGLNKDTTKEELKERIENGTLLEIMNKVYTKPGNSFLIEPGTIHSIGSGNLICEIQECSNVTYRVYDYCRKDNNGNLRELHIEKALDVIDLKKLDINSKHLHQGNCKYFDSELFNIDDTIELNANNNYEIICFINGEGLIDNNVFKKGDTWLVPYKYGKYKIEGKNSFIRIIPNDFE